MSNNTQSDYDKFLASVHANFDTPDQIVREIVKEGTNQDFITKEKIIAGEANEVYDITLANNVHVILRISRQGHPNFIQEKWALEHVKKVGVPVPEILLIKYETLDDQELSLCLMRKVDGEPLERGKIDFNAIPENVRKSYILKAGEILSKIHTIKTHGYGWISGEGTAEYNTSDEIINELLDKKERIYKLINGNEINENDLDLAFTLIDKFRDTYSKLPAYLNHGDYGHKHFVTKDEEIIAILDWGGVRSDSPIYEFACWDYWYGDTIPTDWLKEGYQNKALFDQDFDSILHTFKIMKGIEIIDWYTSQNYKSAVEKAVEKLKNDLNYFKS
jgi:aminoglycoside phosphotransferase (APT) family kinase protein